MNQDGIFSGFLTTGMILILLNISVPLNAHDKPNVIIVITDDQGYGDLGCHGNKHIITTNLDDFSNEAVRFTNFHVSTTCSPTRGALMTGRHTNRLNVFHTIAGRSILFEDEVILPQVLGENGYVCGMFGKWHLGDNFPYRPEDRGFHDVVRHGGGAISQMPDYWGNDYFDDYYWKNGKPEKYEGYCTDVFFSEALRFIEKNKDESFFCYISTNAPHGPLNVPENYLEMYMDSDEIPMQIKRFYGMITNIDDNFGILRDKLDELDLTDNTILIFMTDNGTARGDLIFNAGLRGKKGSEYEGGHRVPFMMHWPRGKLIGGKDIGQLTAHYDILPTLVDIIGLKYSPIKPLDGMSLSPLLYADGKDWPNRMLYIDTQRLQNLVKGRNYSIMDKVWRFVNGNELYYINNDLGQTKNVIDQYPEVAARLAEGYERWWQSIVDEGVNERYAYIKAGSPYENPTRICSHDMMTGKPGHNWHQYGAVRAVQASGNWKIEIEEKGDFKISLRRFPRESGLAINGEFPAENKPIEFEKAIPASHNVGFKEAFLYIADFEGSRVIEEGAGEVTFEMKLPAGKFNMEAQLIDDHNRVYPAYFVYIERK